MTWNTQRRGWALLGRAFADSYWWIVNAVSCHASAVLHCSRQHSCLVIAWLHWWFRQSRRVPSLRLVRRLGRPLRVFFGSFEQTLLNAPAGNCPKIGHFARTKQGRSLASWRLLFSTLVVPRERSWRLALLDMELTEEIVVLSRLISEVGYKDSLYLG